MLDFILAASVAAVVTLLLVSLYLLEREWERGYWSSRLWDVFDYWTRRHARLLGVVSFLLTFSLTGWTLSWVRL